MFGNKITDKITKVSKTSPQNSSKTVESEIENIGFERQRPKERYISPEKKTDYGRSKTNIVI